MKPQITDVGVDTCYSCKSKETIETDLVNQTFWDVLVQAFVSNNMTSENSKCRCSVTSHPACYILSPLDIYCLFSLTVTSCAADIPTTPVAPTTQATTEVPVTNSTSTPPTTPTPPLPQPATGKYSYKPDENSTTCLMANFGLRISVKQVEVCS